MAALSVRLFGPFQVALDGEAVTGFATDKGRALLAYLVVEADRPHRRESLAGLLWPDYPERSARTSLRSALANLRQVICDAAASPPYLDISRQTIQLNHEGEVWSDVAAFAKRLESAGASGETEDGLRVGLLEEAVDLYRGPFLDGFSLADSPAFEEWALLTREQLQRQALIALQHLVERYKGRGDFQRALDCSWRYVELDPWREAAQRGLMRLLALNGQPRAALAQYEAYRRALAEELGAAPEEETTALYGRIKTGELSSQSRSVLSSADGPSPDRPVPAHNLPLQPTPFVGREKELGDLARIIGDPDVRLITIVGPGGIGKTRLALAAAERELAQSPASPTYQFPDGIYFVPLAPLRSAEHILPTLAEALSFRFQGGDKRTPKQQVFDFLCHRHMLLVMDNVEHLLGRPPSIPPRGGEASSSPPLGGKGGGAAELVADILRAAPDVQILTTSRERLYLQEEQVYPIQGLAFSDWKTAEEATYPRDGADNSAAQLFLQSARRVQPDYELEADDVEALAQICHLVDGMPLALELAASWVDALPLAKIAAEVQRGLDFLETEWHDVPPRHRSMRAAIDGSWRLLSRDEQQALAQLSVFHGGFTREAARAVVRAATGTSLSLRTLAQLVNRSLLGYSKSRDRYDVHELLRQFGAEKLEQKRRDFSDEPGARAQSGVWATRDRHSAYYCTALERWGGEMAGPRQVAALDEIEADLENVRAAWEWAAVHAEVARLDQAENGLYCYYWQRDRYPDLIAAFQIAIDALSQVDASAKAYADALRVTAKVMLKQAEACWEMGQQPLGTTLLERCEKLLNSPALAGHDIRPEQARLFYQMADSVLPNWDASRRLVERSLALYRSLGDRSMEAWCLNQLGNILMLRGDLNGTRAYYQESLAIHRALGDTTGIWYNLRCFGHVARDLGDDDEAKHLFREALALSRVQADELGEARSLVSLGDVHREGGDSDTARKLYEQGLALGRELGAPMFEPSVLLRMGGLAMDSYSLAQAEQLVEEALALSQIRGLQFFISSAQAALGHLAVFRGEFKAGTHYLRASLTFHRETNYAEAEAFALNDLSEACWLSGAFSEADDAIERALALARAAELGRGLPFLILSQAQASVNAGRYEHGRAYVRRALAQVHEMAGERVLGSLLEIYLYQSPPRYTKAHMIARAQGVLGWAALAQGCCVEAEQGLGESVASFRKLGDREQEAWAVAGLGRAAHGLGKREAAQAHLLDGLRTTVEIGAFVPLMHLLPVVAAMLADAAEPSLKERAVELYALATGQPFVAKGQLFQDIAGRQIEAASAKLSSEVVKAAQARGQALDWWETAAALLEELRVLGWARSD